MFSQPCLCSAKWICFYCQVFQTWLLIQRVVGSVAGELVVSGRLVGGSVVCGFNKTQEKTRLGWWFRLCIMAEVYFVIQILIFSILMIKKKQIWSPEAITRILTIPKDINIITSNKSYRQATATSSNISFIYIKLPQTFWKSICLVKGFFLVNYFLGVFWGILRIFDLKIKPKIHRRHTGGKSEWFKTRK